MYEDGWRQFGSRYTLDYTPFLIVALALRNDPEDGGREKPWSTVAAVREGKKSLCDVKAAIPEVLCANGAQESMQVADFPGKLIKKQGSQDNSQTTVNGLQAILLQCFNLGILPYEHGDIPWARKSNTIDLRNYRHFPSR